MLQNNKDKLGQGKTIFQVIISEGNHIECYTSSITINTALMYARTLHE